MLGEADKAAIEKEVYDFVEAVFTDKEAAENTEDSSDDSSRPSPNETMVKSATANTTQSTHTNRRPPIHLLWEFVSNGVFN